MLFILRNRSYLGEVTFRDVCHQPDQSLIDPAPFEKAQALLAERGESYDRRMTRAHSDYLLTGLITCSRCGRNYVGVAAAGRGHRYRYYTCFTRQRYGKDACDGERIRADPRVRELGYRARTLKARRGELQEAAYIADM